MNRPARLLAVLLMTLAAAPGPAGAAGPDDTAPPFDLPQRGGNQRVQLANLRGRIVVLDFFAHWCVPCVRASKEVETGLRQYYAQRQGNTHGLPVQVLAVNIEGSRAEKTEAFIQRAGLSQVFEDLQGAVFQKYGGSGLPFLVIIDATGGKSGNLPARVVYRKAGFEGVARLRQVIETIGEIPTAREAAERAATPPPTGAIEVPSPSGNSASQPPDRLGPISTNTLEAPAGAGGEVWHSASLDFSTMWASDILLTDDLLEYRQTRPVSELTLWLSHGHIGLHYAPETALGQERDVDTERYGFQTQGRFRASDRLTLSLGGGAYSGYMDYRSLWFNEHFRQLFSGRTGYETAHPWGCNTSGGARWEYLPAAGFVQGDLAYQHDVISPGYDVSLVKFPPQLERFHDNFDTLSGRLSLENVLTRRLRAVQALQITDTTERQLRFALQSSLNCALAEHWVSRLEAAGTRESPHFQAGSASLTVERDWKESWFLSLTARYYRDNGEVENALLVENTADPPLETLYAGLGLRWQGRQNALKLFAGPYYAKYQQTGPAINTFPHLYQDRDWFAVQFAFAHEF